MKSFTAAILLLTVLAPAGAAPTIGPRAVGLVVDASGLPNAVSFTRFVDVMVETLASSRQWEPTVLTEDSPLIRASGAPWPDGKGGWAASEDSLRALLIATRLSDVLIVTPIPAAVNTVDLWWAAADKPGLKRLQLSTTGAGDTSYAALTRQLMARLEEGFAAAPAAVATAPTVTTPATAAKPSAGPPPEAPGAPAGTVTPTGKPADTAPARPATTPATVASQPTGTPAPATELPKPEVTAPAPAAQPAKPELPAGATAKPASGPVPTETPGATPTAPAPPTPAPTGPVAVTLPVAQPPATVTAPGGAGPTAAAGPPQPAAPSAQPAAGPTPATAPAIPVTAPAAPVTTAVPVKPGGEPVAPAAPVTGPAAPLTGSAALVAAAEKHLAEGDFNKAEDLLFDALQAGEPKPRVYFLYAQIEAGRRNAPAERTWLERTLKEDAGNNAARLRLAELLRAAGLWRKAVEEYNTVLKTDPESLQAYLGLSTVYAGQSQPKRAAEILTEAVKLRPEDASLYLRLGDLYAQRNALAEAEEAYDKAARLSQGESRGDALDRLGDLYVAAQREHEGFICYAEAFKLRGGGSSPLAEKRYQQIMAAADEALGRSLELAAQAMQSYLTGQEVYREDAFMAMSDFSTQAQEVEKFAGSITPPGSLKLRHAERKLAYSLGAEAAALGVEYLDKGRSSDLEQYQLRLEESRRSLKALAKAKG